MSPDIASIAPAELLKLVKKAGGQRSFSKKHGIPRTTLQNHLYKLRVDPFGHKPAPVAKRVGEKRGVRRFILSSAQDSTKLHEGFLSNLEAYRDWLEKSGSCEIMIAGFTYGRGLFESHSKTEVSWPTRIIPYMVSERIRIADKLDFCAEVNILPTASNPLSGFLTYTQDRWAVFPHSKIALQSVPRQKHQQPKQVMSTGSISLSNFVQKTAGIKASFHHQIAAVLVEVDRDGDFFCRHLIADDNGSFYDLDRYAENGVITEGHNIASFTTGDVHTAQICPVVARTTFGFWPEGTRQFIGQNDWQREWKTTKEKSLIDYLRPEHIFIHDVSDFFSRNHHNIGDPYNRFELMITNNESVYCELREVAMLLARLKERNPDSTIAVVESNHDLALKRWLKNADYREDPINAEFFLACQREQYRAIRERKTDFSIFEHVMKNEYPQWNCSDILFLREDQSFEVDGVENANHGHLGANGARGSLAGFRNSGARMSVGHGHSPAIGDGVMVVGTSSKMDLGYNRGMSSWANTHGLQYKNSKRTLITMMNGKWCV